MKHVHWLLPGKNHNLESIRNNIFASVRLRAYVSSINTKSFTFSFGDIMPLKTDVLVIGKIGNFDLEKRTQSWLNQIKMSTFSDTKIILDYTDNHLLINSPLTNFYRSILSFVKIVITPSEKMTSIFSDIWKGPVETIHDSIEVEITKWKKKNSKKLLWFGHATNIIYLVKFLEKHQSIIENYSISIITNQIGLDYFNEHKKTDIIVTTNLWSVNRLIDESKSCDLCIIPSDINSPQKQGAGHNRLITALALGMPVIATILPSYSRFKDFFVDIESKDISNILNNPNLLKDKVEYAQKNIVPSFNSTNISKKWHRVFKNKF